MPSHPKERCVMLEIGTIVVYGVEGVCKISGVEKLCFAGLDTAKDYYVLEHIDNSNGKFYVPVDNELLMAKMQKLFTYEEVMELIKADLSLPEWIDDNKQRSKFYKEELSSYDNTRIFALAKMLYLAKSDKEKRFYVMDEEALKKVSSALYSQLSCVASLTREELLPFICGEIVCAKK